MRDFVDLWIYLSASPLFRLMATLSTDVLTQALCARLGQPPPSWANHLP